MKEKQWIVCFCVLSGYKIFVYLFEFMKFLWGLKGKIKAFQKDKKDNNQSFQRVINRHQ